MTELLTLAEAAKALRHSTSWLRRAVRARRIRAYRPLGGQLRFKAEDLEQVIEQSVIGPKPTRTKKNRQTRPAVRERLDEIVRQETHLMSAVAITRICTECRNSFTVLGWQLDGRCGGCRETQRAKDMARTTCTGCGGPMTPAENRHQCDACWQAEHVATIERYGNE